MEHLIGGRSEHEIVVHDEPHRRARANGDRRLDLEVARGKLVAGARDILLGQFPNGLHEIGLAGESEV
jgi:hypothetical protein